MAEFTTEFPVHMASLVDALNVPDTWESDPDNFLGAPEVQLRITEAVPDGLYTVNMSMTYTSTNVANPLFMRFTLDAANATVDGDWEEAQPDIQQANVRHYSGYQFPWNVTDGNLDIALQVRAVLLADDVSIFFLNFWIQRIG